MTQTMIQIKDPAAPASPAQTSYLESLVTQRDLPTVCERYALLKGLNAVTKGQASSWINELLAAPKKTVATPAQAFTASAQAIAATYAAPAPVDTPQLTELPTMGYYEGTDGKLWYYDVTTKDYVPTLRLWTAPYYTGGKYTWKKAYGGGVGAKVTGTYTPYAGKKHYADPVTKLVYVPKVIAQIVLAGGKPMTLDQVGAKGKALGYCLRCGAALSDPTSLAKGVGPTCAGYWGL